MATNEENQKDKVPVSKSIFKEWLEQLQQESWQLELLISGFAIYGIYASRPLIQELSIVARIETDGLLGAIASSFVSVLSNGWLIFFINLIIHVIFRGLWIGAIGLRYVSDDIDFKSLNYSDVFTNYLKKKIGSYDEFIEKLERVCSVIFAYTFLLFLLFFSGVMFGISLIIITYIGQKLSVDQNPIFALLVTCYVLVGVIVFVDFITLGGLKKVKDTWVSKGYLYVFRFYSTITLSFLYRPLLYNFIDNKYTVRLFYLSLPYIFIVVFGKSIVSNNVYPYLPPESELKEYGLKIYDFNYDDLRAKWLEEYPNEERKLNKESLPTLTLETFEIKDQVTSLFVKLTTNTNRIFQENDDHIPFYKENLSISWFNLDHAEDSTLDSLEENKDNIARELFAQLRKLRKEIKSSGNELESDIRYIELKDSISRHHQYYTKAIEDYNQRKSKMALDRYMDQMTFFIDEDTLKIDKYFFYDHPNFNEKGIKCFFRTDSLSAGFHDLKLKRYYMDDSKIDSSNYVLPFLKIQ